MPKETDGANAADYFSYFNEFWRRMAAPGGGWATDDTTTANAQSEPKDPKDQTPDYGELLDLLARASSVCMNGGFRYWKRWADTYSSFYPVINRSVAAMDSDPSKSGEARGILVDTLRAYLREMVDLPYQESRRLQAELEEIIRKLTPTPDGEQEEAYRRRWSVKQ